MIPASPPSPVNQLLNSSNIESMALLAMTGTTNAEKVRLNLQQRIDSLAAPFFSSGTILQEILRTCDAVISGSSALHFLLPITTTTWKPNDLDLYVPHRYMRELTIRLQNLGYQQLPLNPHTSYSSPHILAVHKFALREKIIDVIMSSTSAAFSPIFLFDSTAVMNFISADEIFSAYPDLTLQYKSLLNPHSLYKHPYSRIKLSHLQKYLDRGFKFIPCRESHTSNFTCRSLGRTITDAGCLWINLHSGRRVPQHPANIFHQYGTLDVEWRLGGHICGSDCFLPPRIHVIEDKSQVFLSFPPYLLTLTRSFPRSYLYSR